MDILRAEAEQLLQDLPSESTDNQYEIVHIKSSCTDYANTTCEDRTLSGVELRTFIEYSPSDSDIISTKIVRMHYHSGLGIKSLSSIFRHVWHSFHLDPYMIYMFHRNVPGFSQLSTASTGNPLLNFYINSQSHWLFWTYDTSTLSTNAILLSRISPGGRAAYPLIHAQLTRYCALAGHPLFLALATALEKIDYVDIFLREQRKRIGHTERCTGFSHFQINKPRPHVADAEAELAQLSNLSRLASSVLVGLADMVQHLQSSTTSVDAILSSSLIEGTPRVDVMVRREAEMKNIASVLRPQLKQRFGYVGYIKERAGNQLTVVTFLQAFWRKLAKFLIQIFNLLARRDAQASIDIAKAAMHDNTSMKTIAIMTMGFLPATFFAALFAVPSLHWDQPTVIGSRFWVYWMVTIPTTILVFVIWFGIMNRSKLLRRMKKRNKAVGEKGKIATERLDSFACN